MMAVWLVVMLQRLRIVMEAWPLSPMRVLLMLP
jgi:hypothetical protein